MKFMLMYNKKINLIKIIKIQMNNISKKRKLIINKSMQEIGELPEGCQFELIFTTLN